MNNKVLFVYDGLFGLYKGSNYGVHYKNELIAIRNLNLINKSWING